MAVYCKMCGGIIEYKKGETTGVCSSCGARQAMPLPIDNGNAHLYRPAGDSRTDHDRGRAAAIGGQILKGIGSGLEKAAPLKETAVRQIRKVKNVQYAEGERKYALFAAICFFLAALVSAAGLIEYERWNWYSFFSIVVWIWLSITLLMGNRMAIAFATADRVLLIPFGFWLAAYEAVIALLILKLKKIKAIRYILWFLGGFPFLFYTIMLFYIFYEDGDFVMEEGMMGLFFEVPAFFLTLLYMIKKQNGAQKRRQQAGAANDMDGR